MFLPTDSFGLKFIAHRPQNERRKIQTISNAIVYNCFLGGVIGRRAADLAERGVSYCLRFQFIFWADESTFTLRGASASAR